MANEVWQAQIGDTPTYVKSYHNYMYKGTGHMVGKDAWEPQRVNNFEVVIEGLDELVLAGKSAVGTDGKYSESLKLGSVAERIMLSVDSFSAPTIEIAQITTQYANNSIKWAGKPEFPNSSLVINDYIGARVEAILAAWFQCAYNFDTECVGLARHYKKTAYLIEYAPNGDQARVWKLEGCWLASFQLGDWNQAGNEQRKLNATLVYDRVIPDYNTDLSSFGQGDPSQMTHSANNSQLYGETGDIVKNWTSKK